MNKITIIIPTLNEAESLKVLLKEIHNFHLKNLIGETIIVDGNSSDETQDVVKEYGCKIIIQKTKKGYGAAIAEGINNSTSFYSVILDGDGYKNPSYIYELFSAIEKNNHDFIFASRYGKNCGSYDDTLLTHFGNRVFTNLGKIFFKIQINDILHTFFICKTEAFKNLNFFCNF